MSTIIIYGPKACGKTRNAQKLAKKYGCKKIIDGWDDTRRPPENALVLTNETPPYRKSNAKAIEFKEAIKP